MLSTSIVRRLRKAAGQPGADEIALPSEETLRAYFSGIANGKQLDEIQKALVDSVAFRESFLKMANDQNPEAGSKRTIVDSSGERLLITEQLVPRASGGVLLRLDGDLASTCVGPLEEILDTLVARKCLHIVVDLSGIRFVCTAGWGLFVGKVRDIRKLGGDIKFAAMPPAATEIFKSILELDRLFENHVTVEEAIQSSSRKDEGR